MPDLFTSRRLLVASAVAAALALPSVSHASSPAARLSGHGKQGLLLIARAQRAYASVPAVVVTGSAGGAAVRFTEVLSHGTVVSEAYIGNTGTGTTRLVSTNGSPTYAEEPGTSCWRVLPRSAPQTLTDIGHPLLSSLEGAASSSTRAVATGWQVTLHTGTMTTFVSLDKKFLVQSIKFTHGNQHATESFSAPTRTPTLPSPDPKCG